MRRSTLTIAALSMAMIALVIAAKSVMTRSTTTPGSQVIRITEGEFRSDTGTTSRVKLGDILADQMAEKSDCCRGNYRFQIDPNTLRKLNPDLSKLSLFLPALGAGEWIKINGRIADDTSQDYTSIGPILPLKEYTSSSIPIEVEVRVFSRSLTFAGLLGGSPYIGTNEILQEVKQNTFRTKVLIPLFDGIIVALLALMFFTIHAILRKRASYFSLFASTLASWAFFFASLSGIFRSSFFVVGSLIHFPLRTVAGYFSLRLAESLLKVSPWKGAAKVVGSFIIIEFVAGYFHSQSAQSNVFVLAGLTGFVPAIKFFRLPAQRRQYAPFSLYLVFLLGQTSDAIKLLSSNFEFNYTIPFFNRYTLLPFLTFCFVAALMKFAETFKELNLQLVRTRQVSYFGAKLSKKDPQKNELTRLAGKIKRLTFSNACFTLRLNGAGKFSFEAVSGNYSLQKITLISNEHSDFFSNINDDLLGALRTIDLKTGERIYLARTELGVEAPLALIFVRENFFAQSENDLSFVSQTLNILKTSGQRTSERKKREASEERFRSLIQKLDPNLYEYVEKNEVSLIGTSENSARGIVFFDQKGYTTLLEDLDENSAFLLAETVNRWVAERTARYAARILNFNGDAYTLELLPLPGESNAALAERICNLVWELSQTVDVLNKSLLKVGLAPIAFRFGANLGKASSLKLDFISPGVMNIVGDNVNVAARLQALARPGSVFVSGELASETAERYVFRKVLRSYVKGRRREVEVFELVGRVSHSERKNSA